jgi:glutamine---fructose-6-phosphate transaminase (isomerizing)
MDQPATGYMRDLLDQPQALRDTVEVLRDQGLPEGLIEMIRMAAIQRIVLTGMGSSLYAFQPLYHQLVEQGYPVVMVETSELLYSLPGLLKGSPEHYSDDVLVIAASQSGYSAEIVALVERHAQVRNTNDSFVLLGISNTPDSPLAKKADACLLTRAGTELSVSCKTYLATLAALAYLGALLVENFEEEEVLDEIEQAIPEIEAYLLNWQTHVAELKGLLSQTRDIFVVGRGPSLAAAYEGGLIIKEASHTHSEPMSSASLRHGPFELLSPEVFVLVFEGWGPAAHLNHKLYNDVRDLGAKAGWVSEEAVEPVFRLPKVPPAAQPLVEILPVQMMTLALSDLKGHEAGKFTKNSKVTTVE